MSQNDHPGMAPEPVIMTRSFAAPHALVFQAWSRAEHIKAWFSPAGYSVAEAEVEFRPGGVFAVCMQAPDGAKNWLRGQFTEILAPERLAFTGSVLVGGETKFTTHTQVTFAPDGLSTSLTVRQDYELRDPAFGAAIAGAPEGWRTTLDRLDQQVARIAQAQPAAHGSFSLERDFSHASPARLFFAFTDKTAKARWFAGGPDYRTITREMDIRPGGREHVQGRWANGTVSTFDAVYLDVAPDRRLVYAYEMHINAQKISVSLATVEITPQGGGARLRITEQGVFLNGYEDNGAREHGTGMLLAQLSASLPAAAP